MDYEYDAFISFAWKDLARARRLQAALNGRGYVTWYAEKNMRAGDDLPVTLSSALQRSRFVFILHSENHEGAPWAAQELSLAVSDEVQSRKVKIVVVKYDDATVPHVVRHKLYVDYRDKSTKPLEKLTALLDEASADVIRGVAGAMGSATDINVIRACAERLSSIARVRGDLLAVREIGAILLQRPANHQVRDSAAWALGDIGKWHPTDEFSAEIREIVEKCLASGDARLIDNMAYIAGEMAVSAKEPGLRRWADQLIALHEFSPDPVVRTPFEYTRARIRDLFANQSRLKPDSDDLSTTD